MKEIIIMEELLERILKVEEKIVDLVKEPIFPINSSGAKMDLLDNYTRVEYEKLLGIFKELIKNPDNNEDEIIVITTDMYILANSKDYIEENKDLINKLSDEDKKKLESLKEERETLKEELIKVRKEYNPKQEKEDLPETLPEIRKEMEEILGKSLFEGIEDEDEYSEKYNYLTSEEINEVQNLKIKLSKLLNAPKANKVKIDETRAEMFIILKVDYYTFGKNYEIINNLEPSKQTRFELLKTLHEIKMRKIIEEKEKQKSETSKKEKVTADSIREKMATLLWGEPKKAYEGIENIDEKDDTYNLDEKQQEEFRNLREELNKINAKNEEPKLPSTQVNTGTKKKKKGRLVKAFKSAKEFYKKHKKAIWFVAGIIILSAAISALLPSIMYLNSALWWEAMAVPGATAEAGLPLILNQWNHVIGAKIGATYAAGEGLWTLASGAILNEGVKQAGILAALGKLSLSIGGIGTGTTIAVVNLCRLAKEKIEKWKNRPKKERPNRIKKEKTKEPKSDPKNNTFKNVKDTFKEKYNKAKGAYEARRTAKEQKNTENEENKPFYREDADKRANETINMLIDRGFITEEQRKQLENMSKDNFSKAWKRLYNAYQMENIPKPKSEQPIFYRDDVDLSIISIINYHYQAGDITDKDLERYKNYSAEQLVAEITYDSRFVEYQPNSNQDGKFQRDDIDNTINDFINYCFEIGVFTKKDLKKYKTYPKEQLIEEIINDPRYLEFMEMIKEWEPEQPKKGGK